MPERRRQRKPAGKAGRELDPHSEIFGPDAVRNKPAPKPATEGAIPASLILYGDLGQLPAAPSGESGEPADDPGKAD